MTDKNGSLYEFGGFVLDTRQNLLLHGGEQVKLPAKAFELLLFFVKNPNQVIDKETLMSEVWKDAFVEEANLAVHISNLRKIFETDKLQSVTIETFPKVGYRFNTDVHVFANGARTNGTAGFDVVEHNRLPSDAPGHNRFENIHIDRVLSPLKSEPAIKQRRIVAIVLTALIVLAASGYVVKRLFDGRASGTQTMERIRGTEQSSEMAISPNGEYLAHTISKAGKSSLMMTNIGSNSSLQLLAPDDALYSGMTFSNDNSFLYFVKTGSGVSSLYKIPVLGDRAVKVLDNIENKISFSPDGTRFCFFRKLSGDETAIMTANADGTDERVVATRKSPDYFSSFAISWSPDGRTIANAADKWAKVGAVQIIGIDVETGAETPLSDTKWANSGGLVWLRDGSGLIASLVEIATSQLQVWLIPYPSGEPRRITDELAHYGIVGVTSDSKTIMAGQFEDQSSIWLLPNDWPDQAIPVSTERHHQFQWIQWTADGRLVFGSSAGGNRDVWTINADGTDGRQLTSNSSPSVMPVASSDGRYIVFASTRGEKGTFNLWRMDRSGDNAVQLTSGEVGWQPSITPDGKWIFFTSGQGPTSTVWKVSIDGGEPVRIIAETANNPEVSPDGKFLLCWYKPNNDTAWKAAIFPIAGGKPIKLMDIKFPTPIHWTSDGKGVSYIKTVDAVSNIWTQPIDGKTAKPVTQFTSGEIVNFDWSSDGRLICSRISKTRDVVLVRNFR